MTASKIEWTQHVWNAVRGCSRVSPGCDNCYAMRQAHRTHGPGGAYEGLTTIRKGKVDWTGFARLVPEQLEVPLRRKKPTTYFVNSMSDLFHESLTNEEIAAVFGVMAVCTRHTFQVLTKRPKRMLEWFTTQGLQEAIDDLKVRHLLKAILPDKYAELTVFHPAPKLGSVRNDPDSKLPRVPWPLPNVWLGVSAENQEQFNKRVPLLLECPAAIRWVSAEPLLGPINATPCTYARASASRHVNFLTGQGIEYSGDGGCGMWTYKEHIDWVVVGGESGHGARDCKLDWIESVVRQCADAKVPVFVKQLGAKPLVGETGHGPYYLGTLDRKGGSPCEWPEHLRVRQFPEVPT